MSAIWSGPSQHAHRQLSKVRVLDTSIAKMTNKSSNSILLTSDTYYRNTGARAFCYFNKVNFTHLVYNRCSSVECIFEFKISKYTFIDVVVPYTDFLVLGKRFLTFFFFFFLMDGCNWFASCFFFAEKVSIPNFRLNISSSIYSIVFVCCIVYTIQRIRLMFKINTKLKINQLRCYQSHWTWNF